jgi:hypothetical protein
MKSVKIISEKVFKAGFVLRREIVETPCKSDPFLEWEMAYSTDGGYIGTYRDAYHICIKRGIYPQKRTPESGVCSIGFSTKNKKWYGWSHRAICGFKIGSKCRKGDCHYTPRNQGGKGAWTAKTFADARQMACDFASSVS